MFSFAKLIPVIVLFRCIFAQDRQINLFDQEGNACLTDVDLMLVLDGSASIGEDNFEKVKEWVKQIGESLQIDREYVKIGVVQYSYFYPNTSMDSQRYMVTEITLGDYANLEAFQAAVDGIKHQGYQTYTAHAINKTLFEDFSEYPPNRYPDAIRAIILLTDGKADDWYDLEEVVQRAEKDFKVIMYAVGIGNYNETELNLITHNHVDRVFTLENFDNLSSIIANLEEGVYENCDCDRHGAIDNDCDPCTRQCTCKPNVFGRRCDMCEDDHYGLESDNGCLPCNCHPEGSTNTSCHAKTGQCSCIEDALGRRCDECPPFNFGTFPNCRECDCNGFSLSCDAQTGECSNCEGGRIGDTCESCPSGHYIDAETGFCIPCPCNGNIDLNDPDSCDAFSGRCEKCLYRTTGDHCEECHDGYYGDALIRSCITCGCDRFRTNQASCTDYVCVCDKGNGQCPCIENATGRTCSGCDPGTWKTDAGCEDCDCYRAGTQAGTTCSEDTGTCECKEGYRGRTCSECDDGYETNLLECTKIVATTTTPPTTTTPTTTPPTTTTPTTTTATTTTTTSTTTTGFPPVFDSTTQKTSLPVNPKWSPCVTCARVWWPSYCQGWYCRRRWPYHQFFPSSQRCYSWNWNCRTNVENTWNQYGYQQQNRRYRYTNSRRPSYYRGYNHHYRSQPVRYSLYRN